jgi:BirA family biotin operon repressor/biotin-[acetyl-CoA-carboxylase] ligase
VPNKHKGKHKGTATRTAILNLLADGALHSGADIGKQLRISRAAVCKTVNALSASGLPIEALSGRGYRLEAPLTVLERRRIATHLADAALAKRIEILDEVNSTNRYLLERSAGAGDIDGLACLAESQPQGRGRRGRGWIATPYSNLMLSMSWRFASGAATLAGLSLAAGVAVVRALTRYGVDGIALKWPNDILWRERKLAGLLVDVHGEATGPCTVVLGVGINCRIAASDGARIDQPWADLVTANDGAVVDRNKLAAYVIEAFHRMFVEFARHGLDAFREEWERHHAHAGRTVRIMQDRLVFEGIAEGVDDHGALRVRAASGERQLFHSGEVSVRASAHDSVDRSR